MNERPEIDSLELLALVSHELRNPLNAILGWATVLTRRADLPGPVMQGLQAIERNTRVQAKMISDLLDYASVSAGRASLAIETIDPYPVVRASLEEIAAAARDAAIAIEVSFDDQSLRIAADPARLQQIIVSVLSNAVKFSTRGGAVRVVAQRREDRFCVAVSDQGKGIDPAVLPGLFERWGRRGAESARGRGALGLGMPMAKALSDLHAGSIRAESPGRDLGATFILELPLCAAS